MSLEISNGRIGTNPPVTFPNQSIVLSSAGITASDGSRITLNTPSSLSLSIAGIATDSGLSLAPIMNAPSAASSGFSVSGSVEGVQPARPTITGVALGASAGQVNISFSLSSILSGQTVTHLTFIAFVGGIQSASKSTSILVSPFTFSELPAGQTFTFTMYTSTASRQSAPSESSSAIMAGSVPSAPVISSASIGTGGSWSITWPAPYNGGVPIDYSQTQVQIRSGSTSTSNGTSVASVTNTPTLSSGNYTNASSTIFSSGGTFEFYVRVKNSVGYSDWSAPKSAVYTPGAPVISAVSLASAAVPGGLRQWNATVTFSNPGPVTSAHVMFETDYGNGSNVWVQIFEETRSGLAIVDIGANGGYNRVRLSGRNDEVTYFPLRDYDYRRSRVRVKLTTAYGESVLSGYSAAVYL